MSSNYGAKTISALKWNTISKLFVQLFNLIISVAVARILDPKDFGIMAIGLIVINYSNTLTNFGFSNALVQKDKIDDAHINSVFSIDLLVSTVLTVFTFSFSSQIATFFGIPECELMFKVLSCIYILTSLEGIPRVILRRSINFSFLSKLDIATNLSNGVIVVSLALMNFGYWSLLIGQLASLLLGTLVLLLIVPWKPRLQYDHNKMKSIFNFGIWNFFRAQIYYINKYIIQVITGKTLGVTQLGFFEKAFSLSQIPLESIGLSINSVMFSTFSRFQNNKKELNKWFLNMVTIQTILIVPLLLGLFAVSSHFIVVVLGEKWSLSVLPTKVLCIASAISVYNGGLASFNIAIGEYKQHSLRTFAGTCFLVIISLVLVRYGLVYMSMAYLLVTVFWTILSIELALRHLTLSFKEIFISVYPYLLANMGMLIVALFLSSYLCYEKNILNFVCIVCSGCFVYSVMVVLINLSKNRNPLYPIKT
jgi:O-antigen/teichoic acid export membrane protein